MRVRLTRRRVAAGHSQESLSALLGVDRTTVGRWERGLTVPQPWARTGLAAALGISRSELDELFDTGIGNSGSAGGGGLQQ